MADYLAVGQNCGVLVISYLLVSSTDFLWFLTKVAIAFLGIMPDIAGYDVSFSLCFSFVGFDWV